MDNVQQNCGLTVQETEEIRKFIQKYPEIHTAKIFGSRALGSYKEASDVDIAIFGEGVTDKTARDLKFDLEEESYLPYFFDVISYNDITVPSLREHIDRHGVTIYRQGWREVKLGEIVDINPENHSFKDEWKYINYLDTPNLTEGKIDCIQKLIPGVDKIPSRAKRKVRLNDILISTVRPNQKHYGMIKKVYDNMLVSTGFAVLRPKTNVVNPNFLYAYISQNDITDYLSNVAEDSTTAYPSITPNVIADLDISLPPLSEQKAIADILGSLDDKIELLHRQNKTLEEMAQVYFRQWFIEEVGEDWETGPLGDYILFDPSEKLDRSKKYRFFDMKCLSNDSMIITDGIISDVKSCSKFRNGDTLLAKITPCLENGKTGFVMCLEDGEVALGSTEFIVMRPKTCVSPYWVYCLARTPEFRDEAILSMTGTSGRQRVQIDSLRNVQVSFRDEVIRKFNSVCKGLFAKIKENTTQISTLTALRDTLLPKLISGEVRLQM